MISSLRSRDSPVGMFFGAGGFRVVVFWRAGLARDVVDFPRRVVAWRLPVVVFLRRAGVRFFLEVFRVAMGFVNQCPAHKRAQDRERIIARMI